MANKGNSTASWPAIVAIRRATVRRRLASALRRRGFKPLPVGTSEQALELFETRDVAALVASTDLPTRGGYELAEMLRRHQLGPDLSIVLLTDVRWTSAQRHAAIEELSAVEVLPLAVDVDRVAALLAAELTAGEPDPAEPLADRASRTEKRQVEQQAQAVRREVVELRGNLRDRPFPQLLHQLYRMRASGALFLLRDKVKKIVYLRDGHPTYVKSNVLGECLGKVLVREELITERQCAESLERMRDSRRQQGTVLIDMGVLSPQDLVGTLQLQLQAKLFDVFRWQRGEFLFKPRAKRPDEVIQLGMSNAALIAEGIRRCWSRKRLNDVLEPQLDRYVVPVRDPALRFQDIALGRLEQAMLDAADGSQTLGEHIATSALSRDKALRAAYILAATGIVQLRDEPRTVTPPPVSGETLDEPELQRGLARELSALRGRDAHGVLSVEATASASEVEEAYATLARRYHPDRFRGYSSETRTLARELFHVLSSAYQTLLGDDQAASERRAQLEPAAVGALSAAGKRSLRAQRHAERARALIDEQRWESAREELVEAVDLCAEAGDLHALLGWATFQLDPQNEARVREAIRELRDAIRLDPRHDRAYLYLGKIYEQLGRSILAQKQFERAVQCNPGCQEALDALQPARRSRRRPRARRR